MRWNPLRLAASIGLFFLATTAYAQQQPGMPFPRLDTVFPLGAKVGTTVEELVITGTDVEDTQKLFFSHPGIKGDLIPLPEPKVDPKDPKKQTPPPPVGPRKFKVTVAADVPPGIYDLRVSNKWGLSNPRAFVVGDFTEVVEKETNNDVPEAQKVEINSTINGVISAPTDVDYAVFPGKKDQRIVVSCLTSSIDSRAIPMIELYDTAGKRLAFNRNYNYNDAVLDASLPADGDYYVRTSQFTYTQGTAQHFYRLSISNGPWIDAVFPPMIEPGKPTQVTLYGRNLPGGTPDPTMIHEGRPLEKLAVTVTPPADAGANSKITYRGRIDPRSAMIDGFSYSIKGPTGTSNTVLIAYSSAKVHLEKENNDKAETPEAIPVPCEVSGRIDKRLDRDWYSFDAKKGDIFSIELWSERLGTSSDFLFTVRSAKATTDLTEQDDNPDIMNPVQFFSRTSDPGIYKFTAPDDGQYLIQVISREASFQFGPRVYYRLRVTQENPDFRLIVMPSSPSLPDTTVLRADGHQYFDVFAFRTDGFTGPITLTTEGLPPGVTCPTQTLSTGVKQGALVVSAAASAATFDGQIVVKGTATINGKQVVREARGATITWGTLPGQNIPTIARLDQGVFLCIRDKAPFRVTLEPENAFVKKEEKLTQPLYVKQGDKLTVPFKVARIAPEVAKAVITLQQTSMGVVAAQAPVTINNGQAIPPIAADKNDGTIVIDVKTTAAPGDYTIVLKASAPMPFVKDPMSKKSANITLVQSTTPITIRVLPTSVGKLTVTGPMGTLKPGMNSEVTLKVARENGYKGEFKVKFVLPMGAKGVAADDVVIPADKDELKVSLKVAGDAPAGNMQNLSFVATATLEGKVNLTAEAKFNATVEKAPAPKKEEPKKK